MFQYCGTSFQSICLENVILVIDPMFILNSIFISSKLFKVLVLPSIVAKCIVLEEYILALQVHSDSSSVTLQLKMFVFSIYYCCFLNYYSITVF